MFVINKIRDVIEKMKDNFLQIFETLILIVCVVFPLSIDVKSMFDQYLSENYLSPDNIVFNIVVERGEYAIAIGLFVFALVKIRKYNKDIMINKRNVYHNYPYFWYLYCANILGIKKCNLVLVPIYMQFKLAIHGVFDEFPLDESIYPIDENEAEITTRRSNWSSAPTEVNIILEDTYPIDYRQLPRSKRRLPTIKISRNDGNNFERHFSQKFIECTINEVRHLGHGTIVNIFATMNPMNTLSIARQVFMNANRGNISRLYVYQQGNSRERLFEERGRKIY